MDHHPDRESSSGPLHGSSNTNNNLAEEQRYEDEDVDIVVDLQWPFGHLNGLDCDDIRETAYEIFFTSCRSAGGRNASVSTSNSSHDQHGNVDGGSGNESNGSGSSNGRVSALVMTPTSKVKTALGLKMLKKSPSRRMSLLSTGFSNGSGARSMASSFVSQGNGGIQTGSSVGMRFMTDPVRWPRRPLTSAEIMRLQMKVTEQSDNRLRKTLTRTLIGQVGKRSETIILPLELLKYLKPSEFSDAHEYHLWQKRQLKILEAGLIKYPSIPLDSSNSFMIRMRDIIQSGELRAIDIGKNSDTMRTLCNCVVSLCWRSNNGSPTTSCHWADGYPLNIHIYTALLRSIFSIRDETSVLDEVDELLELMKKTWSTLGLNKPMHNACFAWVLFEQYVVMSQMEPDLLRAAYIMLSEVENDARNPHNRDETYVKMLSSMLVAIQTWAEKKLLNYHEFFNQGTINGIENLLPMASLSTKILVECLRKTDGEESKKGAVTGVDLTRARFDHYIQSSMKKAFAKIIEKENAKKDAKGGRGDSYEELLRLANETEDLADRERELFTPVLKKWHPTAAVVAAVTLHQCYGAVLKEHFTGTRMLNSEIVEVIERARKLEKMLVQMVAEYFEECTNGDKVVIKEMVPQDFKACTNGDKVVIKEMVPQDFKECTNGGKVVIKEMVPYEVDTVTIKLLGQWIDERLNKGKKLVHNAKKLETWSQISKSEPHAYSAVDLVNLTKETVTEFLQIPLGITEDLILDLAEGLEQIFQDYITFAESCGSKQNYLPTLPPLTRCNKDSMFSKLWKRASPCGAGFEEMDEAMTTQHQHPSSSTSVGTQGLYVRLNTLHYLMSYIHSLDKTLALSPRDVTRNHFSNRKQPQQGASFSYFERTNISIQAALDHISEIATYRLIFLDTNLVFYESLYIGGVTSSSFQHVIRILKENLKFLTTILIDQAQTLAIKEVMKASFEAFLMVLLAGVPSRNFTRSDYQMIAEDFQSLKRVFFTCGEKSISDEVVQQEAEKIEGVISLMGKSTEQLIEDFSTVTSETRGTARKLTIPPATGRWNQSDPNTILRVLCHRNDRTANHFLKKSFQLAKRSL